MSRLFFFCGYADADVLILIVIYNNCFASPMFRMGVQEVKSSHQTSHHIVVSWSVFGCMGCFLNLAFNIALQSLPCQLNLSLIQHHAEMMVPFECHKMYI